MQNVILITGAVTSGKTTFLSSLAEVLSLRWQVDGFLAKAPERRHCSEQFSPGYVLYRLETEDTYPWATPKDRNSGYFFDQDTQHFLDHGFARQIAGKVVDILFLDELGKLELRGKGLDRVLQSAILSHPGWLVCAVKKRFFSEIVEKYRFQPVMCIDLDITDSAPALEKITRYFDAVPPKPAR